MTSQAWISEQQTITHNGIHAIQFDERLREFIESHDVTPGTDEIALLRDLLQPDQDDILRLLEDLHLIEELGEPEPDEYNAALLKAWLDPSPPPLLKRHMVFEVTFAISGCPGLSQEWGWRATRYSDDHYLLCELGTFNPGPLGPYAPLGLIDHADPARSAALLIASQSRAGAAIVFSDGEITCATSISSTLPVAEVYRLMLAWDGVPEAVTMTHTQLRRFEWNKCRMRHVRILMPARGQLKSEKEIAAALTQRLVIARPVGRHPSTVGRESRSELQHGSGCVSHGARRRRGDDTARSAASSSVS